MPYFSLWSASIICRLDILRDSNVTVENHFKWVKNELGRKKINDKAPRFVMSLEELVDPRLKQIIFSSITTRQSRNRYEREENKSTKKAAKKDAKEDPLLAEEEWNRKQSERNCFFKFPKFIVPKEKSNLIEIGPHSILVGESPDVINPTNSEASTGIISGGKTRVFESEDVSIDVSYCHDVIWKVNIDENATRI